MNDLAPHDRPREKLEKSGSAALGDNELVAILIGHGMVGTSALSLASQILGLAGGVHGLPKLHLDQLLQLPGIGRAQASRVQAAVELGRRTLLIAPRPRPRFLTPRDAARFLLPQYGGYPVERFGVVLLDTRCRLISTRLISVGTLDASLANPREVFREAITANAASLIAFHNHPSGDPTASKDDMELTRRLRHAGTIVGVDLIDHIILADTQYSSMKESGLF